MTPEQFVEAIEHYVRDQAVETTITGLSKPAGRKPRPHRVALSEWFNDLSTEDAARVKQVIRLAADASLFSLLVVLDGGSVIDDEKGEFELRYNGERLNQPTLDLHDLFTSAWHTPPAAWIVSPT